MSRLSVRLSMTAYLVKNVHAGLRSFPQE